RDRRPVAGKPAPALPIGLEDRSVDTGSVQLEPGEKRRPEIEAHPPVVARQLADSASADLPPGRRVGRVAFGSDPRVPVSKRSGGGLRLDDPRPGVLARRLIEVTVDAEKPAQRRPPEGNSKNDPAGC